jgi:sirohydrochlorin cobaltochelatase
LADFQAEPSVERLGVLICGHGSRNRLAVEEFAQMVEQLRPKLAPMPVEHGYLEFAQPILREGLESLRQQGVTKVLAIPAMLFAAGHAKNDIPSVLNTYTAETGLPIDYGRELGVDRLMVAAAGARVQEAFGPRIQRHPRLRNIARRRRARILRSRRQLKCGESDANVGGGFWLWLG